MPIDMGKKVLRASIVGFLLGIVVTATIHVMLLPSEERNNAKAEPHGIALEARDSFAGSVNDTLGGEESKLGLAYLVGMKDGLDKETQEMLKAVGLTHLVVASGTHLSIIVEFFKKRFGKISRFAGLLFSLLFVLIFGQIIGWTASITRAAIVSTLMALGWYYGRKIEAWRIILIAMAITLAINPLYIVDLGWQLSFASFTGILILGPILTDFFYGRPKACEKKNQEMHKLGTIADMFFASLSAVALCAPILLYYFGSISLISIVANLLILPTIPFAMGLTFLTGLVGFLPSFFLFDWMRFVVTKVTGLLLDYHLFVMEFFSKQTVFIVSIEKHNALVFLLYLPIVVIVAAHYIKRAERVKQATLKVHSNPKKYLPFTV